MGFRPGIALGGTFAVCLTLTGCWHNCCPSWWGSPSETPTYKSSPPVTPPMTSTRMTVPTTTARSNPAQVQPSRATMQQPVASTPSIYPGQPGVVPGTSNNYAGQRGMSMNGQSPVNSMIPGTTSTTVARPPIATGGAVNSSMLPGNNVTPASAPGSEREGNGVPPAVAPMSPVTGNRPLSPPGPALNPMPQQPAVSPGTMPMMREEVPMSRTPPPLPPSTRPSSSDPRDRAVPSVEPISKVTPPLPSATQHSTDVIREVPGTRPESVTVPTVDSPVPPLPDPVPPPVRTPVGNPLMVPSEQ